jgi:hypothetical protein
VLNRGDQKANHEQLKATFASELAHAQRDMEDFLAMSEEDEIESLNAMLSRIEVADLRLDQAIETLRNSID